MQGPRAGPLSRPGPSGNDGDDATAMPDDDSLTGRVRRYAQAMANTEMQFIKQPTPWLNAGRWSDDAAALKRATGPPHRSAQGFETLFHEGNSDGTDSRSNYDLDLKADRTD